MDFEDRHQPSPVVSVPALRRLACAGRQTRTTLSLFWFLIAGAALQQAKASSIPYPLNVFTVVNSNADGTAASPDGGISVILTGGNNGSGLTGMTDLITTATGDGTISFQYSYSSLDAPGFDWAGYVIGSQFTQLADTDGEFGTAAFSVMVGDTFGFRVVTFDNTSEPGIFTISDFSSGASSVPEPSPRWVVLSTALAMSAAIGRRRYVQRLQEKRS